MKMKKIYEAPTSELIYIASSDIITVSPGTDAEADGFDSQILDIKIGD